MNSQLLYRRICVFWERVNFELRSLEKFKLANGICTGGISCMTPVAPGSRLCVAHQKRAKELRAGRIEPRFERYQGDYGRLRERELAAAKTAAAKKTTRSAARVSRPLKKAG